VVWQRFADWDARSAQIPQTFSGLSGIGDMIVTCMSQHSRNRHLGEQIALGKSLDQVLDDMNMVSEGVRTTCAVHGMAHQHGVEMPITEAVHSVLFEDKRPSEMVKRLMTRAPKQEHRMPESAQQ
jgi:Glycerol-3-phosphate dehydrogenase